MPKKKDKVRKPNIQGEGFSGEIANADSFGKKRPIEVLTLPSGVNVKVQKPSLSQMLKVGLIPANLLSVMGKAGKKLEKNKDIKKLTDDELKAIIAVCDAYTMATVVIPKVIDPKDGEMPSGNGFVNVNDIELSDKMEVFLYAVAGGAASFAPFLQRK